MVTRKGAEAAALALGLGLGFMFLLSSAQSVSAAPGRICVETESGKLTPQMALYKDPAGCQDKDKCSGGAGIEVPEGVDHDPKSGEALATVNGDCSLSLKVAQAGLYQLWARCWWSDGCGNSFRLSLDGGDRTLISGGNYKRWYWAKGPTLRLSAGKHTLVIHNSEDGTRMDQVFLTTDFRYVPVRREKPTQ